MSDAARGDIAIDQDLLRAQADRYRWRCDYWYERAADLADGVAEQPHIEGMTRSTAPKNGADSPRGFLSVGEMPLPNGDESPRTPRSTGARSGESAPHQEVPARRLELRHRLYKT